MPVTTRNEIKTLPQVQAADTFLRTPTYNTRRIECEGVEKKWGELGKRRRKGQKRNLRKNDDVDVEGRPIHELNSRPVLREPRDFGARLDRYVPIYY